MRALPLYLSAAVALALSPTLSAQDKILLTNGQHLMGTVNPNHDPEADTLLITTPQGLVRMRRNLIAHIEESFDTRRANVDVTDPVALTNLAWWCRNQNDPGHAIQLLEVALKLPNPPIDALGLYADLIDLSGDASKAFDLLLAYRTGGGNDPLLLMRLKELEDAKAAFERDLNAPVSKPKVAAVTDGLEASGWDGESVQWSNPVTVTGITLDGENGTNKVTEIALQAGDKDKTAIKRSLRGVTLGSNTELGMYIFNRTDKPIRLSIALKTGNYVFHESMPVQVPAKEGWQEVRFDLTTKTWKSEASNWAHTSAVGQLTDLKELQILFYNNRGDSGSLLLDAVDFTTAMPTP